MPARPTAPAPRRRIFASGAPIAYALMGCAAALVIAIGALGARPVPVKVAGIAVAVVVASYAIGVVARMSVVVEHDGIVVRNLGRPRHIAWDDVVSFSFGDELTDAVGPLPHRTTPLQVYVTLGSGEHLRAIGLTAVRIPSDKHVVHRTVQALDEELDRHIT